MHPGEGFYLGHRARHSTAHGTECFDHWPTWAGPQDRSFRIHSSPPISWLNTEKLNLTQQKLTRMYNKIYKNTK